MNTAGDEATHRIVIDQPGALVPVAAGVLAGVGLVVTPPSQEEAVLGPLIREADAILTWGNTKLTAGLLDNAGSRLKIISVIGVGCDNVDLEWATARGVKVCNTPGANAYAVAEYALTMILVALRNIIPAAASIARGEWTLAEDYTGTELRGKTVGILGLGNIGRRLAAMLKALGCRVIGYDPYVSEEAAGKFGVELKVLDDLCAEADIISLHLPLTPETEHILDEARLLRVKDTALIVNAARAPVVDEEAAARLLDDGRLGGYVTDVYATEPPDFSRPIYKSDRVTATPHIAAMTVTALETMQVEAAKNIRAVLCGGSPSAS